MSEIGRRNQVRQDEATRDWRMAENVADILGAVRDIRDSVQSMEAIERDRDERQERVADRGKPQVKDALVVDSHQVYRKSIVLVFKAESDEDGQHLIEWEPDELAARGTPVDEESGDDMIYVGWRFANRLLRD